MKILERMLRKLPSFYRRIADSNVGRLFTLSADEIEEIEVALQLTKDYYDLENATGATLDLHGENLQELRGGKDDVEYRKYLIIKIISNTSEGNIATFNEVLKLLMHEAYMDIREAWPNARDSFEPAAVVVRYDDCMLFDELRGEYEELDNDPWFFDGEYRFDGSRDFDGGIYFDPSVRINDILAQIITVRNIVNRIAVGGVRVYYEPFIFVAQEINIEQEVFIIPRILVVSDIDIEQDVIAAIRHSVEQTAINRFDGVHRFNGQANFDAQRDRMVQDVTIEEVPA